MPRRTKKRDLDGIFRRPDSPYWWASTPNGRGGTTRRSTGVPIEQDQDGLKALAVRAAWIAQGPVQAKVESPTFDDLILAYLEQVTPTKRAPERDPFSAKALFPFFTGRTLDQIGAAEVRGYIRARTDAGIAAGTINKEIGLMSAALNWARRELEWPAANPWESRRLREPRGRQRWLTEAEAARLLRVAEENVRAPWIADFVRLGLYSGMRPGEMLALRWDQVDLKRNRVTLDADDQKNGKPGLVPLNDEARAALLNRARFRATHAPDSPWVFCNTQGERLGDVGRSFETCVRRAGLTDVHPHDLRRTFGSWLVQKGVGIDRVSKLLRHGDVSITARVYAHLRPSDLEDAAAVLNGSRPEIHARESRRHEKRA